MRRVVVVCLVAASLLGGTGANAAQPHLSLGSHGALVASWQRALNLWLSQSGIAADKRLRARLGGNLVIDGVFGANTLAAAKRFQQESRLRTTGTVGFADWKAWIGAEVTMSGPGRHSQQRLQRLRGLVADQPEPLAPAAPPSTGRR